MTEKFKNGTERPHLGIYDDCCGPHCDARILHEPSFCDSCDKFPHYQKARELWGIAWTRPDDHALVRPPDAILPDPAEVQRSIASINRWGGNVPSSLPPYMAQIADELVHATDPEEIEAAVDKLRALKKTLERT